MQYATCTVVPMGTCSHVNSENTTNIARTTNIVTLSRVRIACPVKLTVTVLLVTVGDRRL